MLTTGIQEVGYKQNPIQGPAYLATAHAEADCGSVLSTDACNKPVMIHFVDGLVRQV